LKCKGKTLLALSTNCFFQNVQQGFAFTPQVNFPDNNLVIR